MKGSKYTDEIRTKARELIQSGMTKHAAVTQLGIPLGTITSWNIPSKNQRFYSNEIKERAKALALEGKSRYKISAELGISYGTLAKWLYGVSIYHKLPESIKQRAIEMLSSG
ncbi:helix-turn-helix domain-containing protein, partial [Candidatus Parvarchaeota archaeon]|nr:helix-turn-helix domain-containing protein [Candidatus Parvarchaeota archaeon]